jgi:penicillin amidase
MDPVWLLRIFTIIPALLILVAGAGVLWIYFFVISLLPEGQTQVDIPNMAADVRVVRDSNGVPGIIGEKEEDVALVLGYVMAQDRLWQMDYLRRAGQGRLAEIMGSDYLEGDHLMRTVKAGAVGDEYPDALGKRERAWLEKFFQGVNKYITSHRTKLPVEFSLLEYHPEPFVPADANSILYALAWQSSIAERVDPAMSLIVSRLGKEKGVELLPTDPGAMSGVFANELVGWNLKGLIFSKPGAWRFPARPPAFFGGCAWVAGGERTRSHKPMAACNVYQGLVAPSFWYRARLVAGDFRLSGAFIPGVPVAFAGTNARTTWAAVTSLADDADLFIERVEGNPPQKYWRVDRWKKVEERRETYRTRRGSSVVKPIYLTETGPLVSDAYQEKALSLRWTAKYGLGFYPALYALNRAQDGGGIRSALRTLGAPCLNVAWADEDGNFGTQFAGKIPVRCAESDGVLPVPAYTGVHDWGGFIPFEELPTSTNNPDNFSVMADGRPGGMDFPFFMSCYWNDLPRDDRLRSMLSSSQEHQRETFQAIQVDNLSSLAKALVPLILQAGASKAKKSRVEDEALKLLAAWDFQMNREAPAAAVFGLVHQALVEELLSRRLGDTAYEEFAAYAPLTTRIIKRIFVDKHKSWLIEAAPEQVLSRVFDKALDRGESRLGSDPKKWKWGELHRVEFRHPLTTRSRFLETLYNVGPASMSGSDDSINFAGWSAAHPFKVVEGVSLRHIGEMTDPPQAFGISPLGASAHFFSTHYKDQTSLWLAGRLFSDPIQTADIRKGGFNAVLFKSVPGNLSLR